MKHIKYKEKGQTIILVVVSILIMVVMAALVVDGGNAFMRRRQAQTAADAAALAAAFEKCVNKVDDLQPIVDEYATVQNDADEAAYSISAPDTEYPMGRVTVVATLSRPTFFAKVLNRPTITVSADASASCFYPSTANDILPIAWTCRQREGGSTGDCILKTIEHTAWEELTAALGEDWFFGNTARPVPATNPVHILDAGGSTGASYYDDLDGVVGDSKMLYVVMDEGSFDVDTYCEEYGSGPINCDFDDDGILDVEGGANRGWLMLDGTGASDLSNIMRYGYGEVLDLPQWFPGQDGVAASVFDTAEDIAFRINVIPVFNAICEDTTYETLATQCSTEYAGEEIMTSTGNQTYYRVPAVAAFVITCVSGGNSPNEYCPGREFAGVYDQPSLSNTKTIEGYFIDGYVGDGGASNSGFDLGVYIISLVE